jgi:toxin ParE1/3/4
MMLGLRLTPRARADLDHIWEYTTQQWSVDQAEAYLLTLDSTMQILRQQPELGRKIDDVRQGYLKFLAASHILIYRIKPDCIEIMRILHKSSDVERHV